MPKKFDLSPYNIYNVFLNNRLFPATNTHEINMEWEQKL